MQFSLTVEMLNAAFEDDPGVELARILREVAAAAERGETTPWTGADTATANVRDYNGNTVGEWTVTA